MYALVGMDGQRVLKRLQAGDVVAELVVVGSPPGGDVAGVGTPEAVAVAVLVAQPEAVFPEGYPRRLGEAAVVIEGAGIGGAAGPGDGVGVDAVAGDEGGPGHDPVPGVVVAGGDGHAAAAVGGGAARDIEELVADDGEGLVDGGDIHLPEGGDRSARVHGAGVVLGKAFALLDLTRQADGAVRHIVQPLRPDLLGRQAVVDASPPWPQLEAFGRDGHYVRVLSCG